MTQLTDWHRSWANRIASGTPLVPCTPVRAKSNHLVASNDEPEADPAVTLAAERARQEQEEIDRIRKLLKPEAHVWNAI